MKLTLLFTILSLVFTSYAQQAQLLPTLFKVETQQNRTAVNLASAEKIKQLQTNPMYMEVRTIEINNLAQSTATERTTENPGYLRFSIPNGTGTRKTGEILAVPTAIETLESGNYTYFADLLTGKDKKGNLILTHEDGKNYGSILLEDRVFRIEHLDTGDEILIELNQKLLNSPTACATVHESTVPVKAPTTSLNHHCNSRNVRVLVLFTDRANNVSNPAQLSTTLINELRSAISNSQITSSNLRFQLVGTQRIDFNESQFDVTGDLDDLVANDDLNNFRENAGADLVVVLSDGNYTIPGGRVLGIATLDQYSQSDAGHVAIVEADAGDVTFAHELGHLMGCRHDNDNRTGLPNLSNTAKGHNWFYRNWFLGPKKYQKSVVASGSTNGSRVLYFSNPAVKAHSKARDNTGTSTRNNFVQLKNAAPIVGCYNDFEEMTVRINGPSTANIGDQVTLSASVSNCPSRTYRWEVSYDGFSYNFLSNASSVNQWMYPQGNSINTRWYRLTVTCSDGQQRTTFKSIYIYGEDGPFTPLRTAEPTPTLASTNPEIIIMYPNPSAEEVNLLIRSDKGGNTQIKAHSLLTGKSHKLYSGKLNADEVALPIDVSRLDQGMYQVIIIQGGKKISSKRLIIER